jgi:flagellar motility protein MotE (MotC chaperone)
MPPDARFFLISFTMKTITEVKEQIAENEARGVKKTISEREYKKLCNETEVLRTVLKYLETKPSEDYLKREKERLEAIVKAKNDQYEYWLKHNKPLEVDPKNARSYFNKESGVTVLSRQLKTIKIILDQ